VSAAHALDAEVRLYDHLFAVEKPGAERDFLEDISPASLKVVTHCKLEAALGEATPGAPVQFERLGYFVRDSRAAGLVFNRTVTLRDSWAKEAQRS